MEKERANKCDGSGAANQERRCQRAFRSSEERVEAGAARSPSEAPASRRGYDFKQVTASAAAERGNRLLQLQPGSRSGVPPTLGAPVEWTQCCCCAAEGASHPSANLYSV